jgi:hypothetical protein
MSFTVQEAPVAFFIDSLVLPRITLAVQIQQACLFKQRWRPGIGDARDLKVFRC